MTALFEYIDQTLTKPRYIYKRVYWSPWNPLSTPLPGLLSARPSVLIPTWYCIKLHGAGINVAVIKLWLHVTNIIFLCQLKINCMHLIAIIIHTWITGQHAAFVKKICIKIGPCPHVRMGCPYAVWGKSKAHTHIGYPVRIQTIPYTYGAKYAYKA